MYPAQYQTDSNSTDEYTRYDPEQVHYLNAHIPAGIAIE